MPVLLALPLYLFIYANTLVKPSAGETGALATGKTLYVTNCSGCHGASGEGGVGPAFTGGAVITTWPDFKDHIKWVSLGSGKLAHDPTYGAQSKTDRVRRHADVRPALTDVERSPDAARRSRRSCGLKPSARILGPAPRPWEHHALEKVGEGPSFTEGTAPPLGAEAGLIAPSG